MGFELVDSREKHLLGTIEQPSPVEIVERRDSVCRPVIVGFWVPGRLLGLFARGS